MFRRRIQSLAILTLLMIAGFWLVLPLLMPELELTQRPPEYADAETTPDQPESHVFLPIELPIAMLEQRLTQELDASLARKRDDSDFKVWRTGPLQLRAHGSVIHLSIPLNFKSSAGPDTKGGLVVHTRISARIAPDWAPVVSVNSSFDWVKKPKVRLLLFRVRVSGVVGRAIKSKLREMDSDLRMKIESGLLLQPRAQAWWEKLHQPDRLNEDPPVWLTAEPKALFFEPLHGDGKNLRMGIGIRAKLATSVASEPAPVPLQPLPPLRPALAEDRGFAIYLPVVADYQGLVAKLREELVGREIRLERGRITPTDFILYTSGRSLVVGIEFRGDAPGFWMDTRGIVYFTGVPQFDPASRVLKIEDFQFTRRLSNPLLHTATWVMQDSLREQMQSRLQWDLSERLHKGSDKLTEQLNQPLGDDMQMSGTVEHLNLTGIACRKAGIEIGLEVRGQLKVKLIQPSS